MAGRTFLASWHLSATRSHACAMWLRVARAPWSPNVRAISKPCRARRRYSSALLATIQTAYSSEEARAPRCQVAAGRLSRLPSRCDSSDIWHNAHTYSDCQWRARACCCCWNMGEACPAAGVAWGSSQLPAIRSHSSANRSRAARVCWVSVACAASKQALARRRYSSPILVTIETSNRRYAPPSWTFQRSA